MGRNTRMMIRMPNRTGWATSFVAVSTMERRLTDEPDGCSLRWRYTFSTTTTDPSTIMPIAITKPPKDMRLAVKPT